MLNFFVNYFLVFSLLSCSLHQVARSPANKISVKACLNFSRHFNKLTKNKFSLEGKKPKFAVDSNSLEGKVNAYIAEFGDGHENYKLKSHQIVVGSENLDVYLDSIGKGSIELLNIPSAHGNTGHLALRVDREVFHMQPALGLIVESLDSIVNDRYKRHRIFGYALQVSAAEIQKLKDYFSFNKKEFQRYSLVTNNCSQVLCRMLSHAGVKLIPNFMSLDPSVTTIFTKFNPRLYLNTIYNIENPYLMREKLGNRVSFYTIGFLLISAFSTIIFAGFSIVETISTISTETKRSILLDKKIENYADPISFAKDILYLSQLLLELGQIDDFQILKFLLKYKLRNRVKMKSLFRWFKISLEDFDRKFFTKFAADENFKTKIMNLLALIIIQDLRTLLQEKKIETNRELIDHYLLKVNGSG